MALPNLYHHRRVAASASKSCFICYKPTDSVLITPDNRDFFYTCAGHLTDRGFATPVTNKEEEEAKKKKEELDKEIEQVKKEYEEKMKNKKSKKSKDKDKDKEADKKNEKKDNAEEERDQKIKELEKAQTDSSAKADSGPRIFTLHKNVYEMRVNRLKNMQAAKRNQERQQQQGSMIFPSAPTGDP